MLSSSKGKMILTIHIKDVPIFKIDTLDTLTIYKILGDGSQGARARQGKSGQSSPKQTRVEQSNPQQTRVEQSKEEQYRAYITILH